MIPTWIQNPVTPINQAAQEAAMQHQQLLTKPPGSLGKLEELAIRLAGMQGVKRPNIERPFITIFAGDHGIAEENVSAFPQAVTAEMIRNFARGGAAISVLSRENHAQLSVVNTGTVSVIEPLSGVVDARVAAGTANFAKQAAMSEKQLSRALEIGHHAVAHAQEQEAQLFIAGEMGIANTSSATALCCALLNLPAEQLSGPGTGLDNQGVAHKITVLNNALALHSDAIDSPIEALRHFAGFEVAAICGAYISCAQLGIPALVDGFITSAAALAAIKIKPEIAPWLIYAHTSQEPGHIKIMQALNAEPLLNLNMRLGEASGAAMALPIIRLACNLHSQMATFAEAEVVPRPRA